jgi:hypothetical protein
LTAAYFAYTISTRSIPTYTSRPVSWAEEKKMSTHSIDDIVAQLQRVSPSQTDDESGYIAHHDTQTVGWYTASGNAGHPLMRFSDHGALETAYLRLAGLDDAQLDTDRYLSLRDVLKNIPNCEIMV